MPRSHEAAGRSARDARGTSRVVFRNHLETCVAEAMREGRTEQILDELMETLKYDKRVLRPSAKSTAS